MEQLEYDQLKNLTMQGVISKDAICEFNKLYKGCWSYTLEVNEKVYLICGGEASYQSAYDLKLKKTYRVRKIVKLMDKFNELQIETPYWDDYEYWNA